MSNTKEPKVGTDNAHESLIERAAARIGADNLVKPAGNLRPPRTAEKISESNKSIKSNPEEASEVASKQQPNPSEIPLRAGASDKFSDKKTTHNGNGLIKIRQEHSRRAHIFAPGSEQARWVEEFRQIKRSLLHRMYTQSDPTAKNANLVLVTSSKPNEGKTFVAINLAISIASEKDLSVILIDVDQTKRGIREYLGITGALKGINDVLDDASLSLADVIIKTDIEGLSVIPSGEYHSLGTELLSSNRMTVILEELEQAHHGKIIIFDAPPVLATTEAAILAQYVGQVVFVVEADKTSQSAIEDALSIIGHSENIGFVLNKMRTVIGDAQFGSYYYYGFDKPPPA